MHIAMVNAHILYCCDHKPQRGQANERLLNFIQNVAIAWKYERLPSPGRSKTHHSSEGYGYQKYQGTHIPFYAPNSTDKDGKQKNNRRKCVVCKTLTNHGCRKCNIGLCLATGDQNETECCWYKHHFC